MSPFSNPHSKETQNSGSRQRRVEIPVRWRLVLLALCTYIIICIVVIGYLAFQIYTSSPGLSGNSPAESSAVLFFQVDEQAVPSARSSSQHGSFGKSTDSDWIDFDWPQWFGLDRV